MIRNLRLICLTPLFLVIQVQSSDCKAQIRADCDQFRTQTPGGWGSTANGNNPGAYRDAHFSDVFPDGVTIGCDYSISFSTTAAVEAFLPSGGTPSVLSESLIDPVNYNNTLAGHLLAITLSLAFDQADQNFALSSTYLGDQIVAQGTFVGKSVTEVVALANAHLGGCSNAYTSSQFTSVLSSINENYVDGITDNGFLDCPPEGNPCSISLGEVTAVCTQDGNYTVQIYLSGTNGCYTLLAPNALSGNGFEFCFGNPEEEESVNEVMLELSYAQDDSYSFSVDSQSDSQSTCSISTVTGNSPECCELTIDCSNLQNQSFACVSSIPDPDESLISYSNNCGDVTIEVSEITIGNGCASSPFNLTRVYSVSDGQNTVTCEQTFQVIDNVAPIITCPDPQYANCSPVIEPDVFAAATDNCDTDVAISYYNGPSSNCGQFTRTWMAVDNCGNSSFCYQTVFVEDNAPPALVVPNDISINCGSSMNPVFTGSANATDVCSSVTLTYSDGVPSGEGCTQTITRTWVATDACGNSTSADQIITKTDNTGPVIIGVPPGSNLQCGEAPPPAAAYAIDYCSGDTLDVTFTESISIAGCRTNYFRIYSAVDECGNISNLYRNITIQDTQGPQLICPADVMLACGDENYGTDDIGLAEAIDNCSGTHVTITYEDSERNINTCPPTIQRTWTAVDTCGNVSNCIQRIMFEDNNPPSITCTNDTTVTCGESGIDPEFTGTPTATDECSSVSLTYTDGAMYGNCPMSFVRTWKAADACNNLATCIQIITVIDEEAPTISCPADITVSCAYSDAKPIHTGMAIATDQCLDVSLTYEDGEVSGTCSPTFIRTWIATDYCGNVATCNQQISFFDNMLPVVFCPADTLISCGTDTSPESLGMATAVDFCNDVSVDYSDVDFFDACPASILRTWTATDACGNARSCVQTIEFEEGGLPQILCPEDITVACDASTDPSSTGFPSGAGSCSEISISYSDSIVEISGGTSGTENCCDDDCGTFRTQTQGGWGTTSHGSNPGSYRDAHFAEAFPNGLVVGCDFNLTLTSSEAVQNFLPSGGSTRRLSSDLTDPTGFKSTLAGQLVAATLSVGFDYADPNYSESAVNLGELTVASGEFSGQTVNQILEIVQNYFGGCASPYTGSELISVLAGINENFVDGNQDHGFLDCPEGEGPTDPSDNCFEIIRTWVATDACGNEVTCQQVITGEVFENNLVIEETKDKTLLAYPSPTNDWVYLAKAPEMKAGDMIRVMNVSGQEMFRFTTPEIEDKVSLDLSTLERGMYIIEWNGTELTESVIVFKN
ncbi:T9SS type A sorting domain-containing protein [Cryomorpha ignava]|uniref:T9SS type A sorting domain-containing protein n=1 Tax=Cryomorpha ignava TaxID=101383 RepID=A0A7K3WW99_9FLAO|nr:T9SS type A sorting domain-containing protein [Cryomorpha ignava]NEN25202.1 T9SS type A sorting domain-containing protein [Cryomorpha ignava]